MQVRDKVMVDLDYPDMDPDLRHLRGMNDYVPDFVPCHQRHVDRGQSHHGLLLFANDTFPRHRHDAFVGQLVATLEEQLLAYPGDDDSSWIRGLTRT